MSSIARRGTQAEDVDGSVAAPSRGSDRSLFLHKLRAELEAGEVMAADPENAALPDLALRTTTLRSRWYARTCRECRLKFREGDRVRLCPRCEKPYHDDHRYELRCWPRHFASRQVCTEGGEDRFSGAEIPRCDFVSTEEPLDDSLPAAATSGERVETAAAPPALLVSGFVEGLERFWRPFGEQESGQVEPGSALVGRNCPWCRFKIRAGDWVVACPCGCGARFHQDVFRHLTCWNEWNGVEGNDYCPNTGRSYAEAETGRDEDGSG